jgi:hypothetical protein
MDSFNNLLKKENMKQNMGQHILSILFIIYLIVGVKTPQPIAGMVDNIVGKILVVVTAIVLFSFANPILGILGFIVAFELIRRSSVSTGTYALNKYLPTEQKKQSNLTAYNQFPYTLEQEVVKKMAPITYTSSNSTQIHFKPILEDNHDAAPINYTGVI